MGGLDPGGAQGEQLQKLTAFVTGEKCSRNRTAHDDGDDPSGAGVDFHLILAAFRRHHIHGSDWGIVSLFLNGGQRATAPDRRQYPCMARTYRHGLAAKELAGTRGVSVQRISEHRQRTVEVPAVSLRISRMTRLPSTHR